MFKLLKNSQKALFYRELAVKRPQQVLTTQDFQNIIDDVLSLCIQVIRARK